MGSEHTGPFNVVREKPDYRNPLDVASWKHDRGYAEIEARGYNPYVWYNYADEEYLNNPSVRGLPRAVFSLKKYLSKRGLMKRKANRDPVSRAVKRSRRNGGWVQRGVEIPQKKKPQRMPRRYRKRKFSRRRRKGTSTRSRALKALLSTVCPIKKICGECYSTPRTCTNNSLWLFCKEPGTSTGTCAQQLHGGPFRHGNVMEAAWGATTSSNFSGAAENYWLYSRTQNTLYNAGNNNLYVTALEVIMRPQAKLSSSTCNGPLQQLGIIYSDTNTNPADVVNVSSAIVPNEITTQLSSDTMHYMMVIDNSQSYRQWPARFWDYYKVIGKKKYKLNGGQCAKYVQTSHYGKVTGDRFSSHLTAPCRYVIWCVRGQFAIDNAAPPATFGTHVGAVAIHTQTTDVVRQLPARKYPQVTLLDSAAASGFLGPTLTGTAEIVNDLQAQDAAN